MNNWTISGNLGKDCEVRTTANSKTVCEFSVAVKSGRGDYEKANWVKCVILDKRAESKLVQYLTKGMKVFISGELSLDSWEKDGVTRSMLKLVVSDLELGGKAQEAQQAPQQAPPTNSRNDFDSDIPF